MFIIPDLKQDVYLGIDFWDKFGLLDKITSQDGVAELDVGTADESIDPPNYHVLSKEEKARLDKVITVSPSFATEGLGRTSLITHSIDVGSAIPIKQRHWPVSPAIEKIMFAEVDNMLALDVIEESNSPWSSNCVLVKKEEKY